MKEALKEIKEIMESIEKLEKMCDGTEEDKDLMDGICTTIHNNAMRLALYRRLAEDVMDGNEFDEKFAEEYKEAIKKAEELSAENLVYNAMLVKMGRL